MPLLLLTLASALRCRPSSDRSDTACSLGTAVSNRQKARRQCLHCRQPVGYSPALSAFPPDPLVVDCAPLGQKVAASTGVHPARLNAAGRDDRLLGRNGLAQSQINDAKSDRHRTLPRTAVLVNNHSPHRRSRRCAFFYCDFWRSKRRHIWGPPPLPYHGLRRSTDVQAMLSAPRIEVDINRPRSL